ncbi:hypothetical protein ACFXOS_07055 [Streptomyces sp. NPDC059175]|uniref:hypothetical protein n=1 Tax=Streptomyces sp. NPDC059175 TaxID=3346757 RepID=UPI0036999F36
MNDPGTFEIRIICDPEDGERITAALAQAFTIGPIRSYPTRDQTRTRLYITATDREPAPVLRLIPADHHTRPGTKR